MKPINIKEPVKSHLTPRNFERLCVLFFSPETAPSAPKTKQLEEEMEREQVDEEMDEEREEEEEEEEYHEAIKLLLMALQAIVQVLNALMSAPPFPIKTQAELVLASAGLHNFLCKECRSDEFPIEYEDDESEEKKMMMNQYSLVRTHRQKLFASPDYNSIVTEA
ncbi:hypothetical protein DVH24_034479 [Malus domestica]|uniref:Uncharacterized protein n=1 Tax=Malus domestica TaxID=3750 RepID=A0A498IW25_MALDO|nr:hypothetical protein DVH24_034479 [Malus domestica]